MYDRDVLRMVFGLGSSGATPLKRAENSSYKWVRSQDMLGLDGPNAKGLRMSSVEALEAFGFDTLVKCIENAGVCICKPDEPSASLIRVRKRLNYTQGKLAFLAGVSSIEVADAEDPNTKTPMSILVPICNALNIDPRNISFVLYY